jgi:LmbE family N-acetylglucosaminyl deacetylase
METTSEMLLPRRLLGVWAHPDDETYLTAGLMARTIEAGGAVTVLTATCGELGLPAGDGRTAGQRATLRRAEMAEAMAVLGVVDVRYLHHPDGGLAGLTPGWLATEIAACIDQVDPDMIVTFDPSGATGHPDHIAACEATTAAWIDTGTAARPLYYTCQTPAWYDEFRTIHDAIGMWMGPEPAGTPERDVSLRVDLSPAEADRTRVALAGHHSQTQPVAELMGEHQYRRWWQSELLRHPSPAEIDRHRRPAMLPVARQRVGSP